MAQINFNDVDFSSSNNSGYSVEFFNLKNDGDEAIVRIMHDSVSDFEILTTHEIREDGKYRGRVNCIRNPKDELSKCPICASGQNVNQRMYIHLIHYVPDENGNIIPKAKIWERNVYYANQIKGYIDNYGPMSDLICKIVRRGKPGDQKTKYDIIPNLNKQVYRDDVYVKDTSLFENYKTLGTVVQERDYNDLMTYIQTGHMPRKQTNTTPNSIPVQNKPYANDISTSQPMYNYTYNPNIPDNKTYVNAPNPQVTYSPYQNVQTPINQVPFNTPSEQQLERPVRSYY